MLEAGYYIFHRILGQLQNSSAINLAHGLGHKRVIDGMWSRMGLFIPTNIIGLWLAALFKLDVESPDLPSGTCLDPIMDCLERLCSLDIFHMTNHWQLKT